MKQLKDLSKNQDNVAEGLKKIVFLCMFCATCFGSRGQILNPFLNDAFMLSKHRIQTVLGYSFLGTAYDGDRNGIFNSFDFQLGYGLTDNVSLRARYEKAWSVDEMGDSENFISIGPAFQLKRDRISLYLPIGTSFSKEYGNNYWEFTPTVSFSLPIGRIVFFNPAVELGFIFCEDCSPKPYLGIDLGVGVRATDLMTIYAGYDLLYSFENFGDGHNYMLNAGAGFKIGKRDKS